MNLVLIELRMILIRMAEINKDIDFLGFGGVDPLNHASEIAGGGGGGEIDIGPQLWRGGCDRVPVLFDKAQGHHSMLEVHRVTLGVGLEDLCQDLGGEHAD
jgi:hypothetical protein